MDAIIRPELFVSWVDCPQDARGGASCQQHRRPCPDGRYSGCRFSGGRMWDIGCSIANGIAAAARSEVVGALKVKRTRSSSVDAPLLSCYIQKVLRAASAVCVFYLADDTRPRTEGRSACRASLKRTCATLRHAQGYAA